MKKLSSVIPKSLRCKSLLQITVAISFPILPTTQQDRVTVLRGYIGEPAEFVEHSLSIYVRLIPLRCSLRSHSRTYIVIPNRETFLHNWILGDYDRYIAFQTLKWHSIAPAATLHREHRRIKRESVNGAYIRRLAAFVRENSKLSNGTFGTVSQPFYILIPNRETNIICKEGKGKEKISLRSSKKCLRWTIVLALRMQD